MTEIINSRTGKPINVGDHVVGKDGVGNVFGGIVKQIMPGTELLNVIVELAIPVSRYWLTARDCIHTDEAFGIVPAPRPLTSTSTKEGEACS